MSRPERPVTEPVPCRSCSAPILWAVWAKSGKKCPIDAEPVLLGDLVLRFALGRHHLRVAKFDRDVHGGRRRFVSHFATCPESDENRKTP